MRGNGGIQPAEKQLPPALCTAQRFGDDLFHNSIRIQVLRRQGPWQGDMNAVIASCSEYTWLTKHKRVDGTMYSCTSLGVKLGGGLGTAITGWLLAFSNYDKALAVQPDSCINMLKLMYLVIPFVLDAIITFILSRMKVEEANDKIRAKMKN